MWPFDQMRERKYDRRYKAALLVHLATRMFEQLDSVGQARVEAEVVEGLRRAPGPGAAGIPWAQWHVRAALRAAAMERLGIKPTIPALTWAQLFMPWNRWNRLPQWPLWRYDARPLFLIRDYLPMERATTDAKAFLRRNGMDIADVDPWGQGNLESFPRTRDRLANLRKVWKRS